MKHIAPLSSLTPPPREAARTTTTTTITTTTAIEEKRIALTLEGRSGIMKAVQNERCKKFSTHV